MKRRNNIFLKYNTKGSIIVEATILLPIMIMIFAGLVLLSMYLPARAQLQRLTQYVASGIATARSDGSVNFSADGYSWTGGSQEFANVYAAMFATSIDSSDAKSFVVEHSGVGFLASEEGLTVECGVKNYVIYKEVFVSATKSIPSPIDLSIVGFPKTIDLTVTSTAVVQNGDEFVRNMDLAADFTEYLAKQAGIDLSAAMKKIQDLLAYIGQ